MNCQHCGGTGRIVRTERETWGGSRNWCHTGREVERLYPCEACKGTGRGPETPPPADLITWEGLEIDAPGFTSETFAASIVRAQRSGVFHVAPAGHGAVTVTTESGTPYTVTRRACSCQGHIGHGHCKHRAGCLWLSDVCGIDLCRGEILGFDADGHPVTAADVAPARKAA